MTKKITKKNKSFLKLQIVGLVVCLVLLSTIGIIKIGKAQVEKSQMAELTEFANSVSGNGELFLAGLDYLKESANDMLGATANHLKYGYWDTADGYYVDGNEIIDGNGALSGYATTTVNELSLGSRFYFDLDLSATSTTPGTPGSITNTGEEKICQVAEINITTGSSAGGRAGAGSPFAISLATTTAVGVGNQANLIATSTIATSSTWLFDTTTNKGSGINTAGTSFLWKNGEVIQAAFNGITGDPATSTASLTGMAGRVYVVCHTR